MIDMKKKMNEKSMFIESAEAQFCCLAFGSTTKIATTTTETAAAAAETALHRLNEKKKCYKKSEATIEGFAI